METQEDRPRIAVLGLGRRGSAFAQRLTATGHQVIGWTRSGRRVEGIASAATPDAAVRDADVVVLAPYDDAACREVVASTAGAIRDGMTIINTSTIGTEEAAALAGGIGAAYVHAPVIGSTPAVAAGSLTLLAAGSRVRDVRPVLELLGRIVEVEDAAMAAGLKLIANSSLAGAVLALRESLRQADALGLPRDESLDVLAAGPLGGLVNRKRPFLDGATGDAEFTVGALTKDADLVAATSGSPFPAACALAEAPADLDIAAVALVPAVAEKVLAPLRSYAAGHATGDPTHFREAFLPSAHIEGVRDGAFTSWSLDDYCALFEGGPADDEPSRRRRIDSVDVAGSVATARMTLWHGQTTFTDVFLLVLVDGRWWIANKAYHRH